LKEEDNLQIKYSDEVDVMIIELKNGKPVDSRDIAEGVIVHLDKKGIPLEIEILDASRISDIQSIISVPVDNLAA
jgi:uncharacterized protein YuzE